MKKDIFYDTDCLSCFVIIDDVTILKKLFDKVIIPSEVYSEFEKVSRLCRRVDLLVQENFVEIIDMDLDSEVYELFTSLFHGYHIGKEIGRGEAAAIALAVKNNGILASNNTKDIITAIKEYNLTRIKTGDILVKAFNEGFIDEEKGNKIWAKMLKKNRYLTADSFSDYLEDNPESIF